MAEQLDREAIIRAMTSGNGRGPVVRSPDELIARLTEDGINTDRSAFEPVLEEMLADGVIEVRQGVGLWLSNTSTLWLSEEKPQPIGDPESVAWGPDGAGGPQLRYLR